MKASIVDGYPKGNKMKILIEDVEASQVNALRRAIIADVPKMAISKVMFTLGVNQDNNRGEIYESVNALPDEVIAHRLAMVPIPTQPDEGMAFPDECENCMDLAEEDKGCPNCQVLYTLNVQGPSSDSDEPYRIVRAGDLTNVSDPVFDISEEMQSIPITYLAQGQFLEFIAFATLGRGRDHAKWSAASAVTFQPLYEAELKKPKKASVLFDLDLKTSDGRAIDAKLFTNKKCSDISTVLDLEKALNQVGHGTGRDGDFDDAIVLNKIDGSFVFSYETDGSLAPEAVFNIAIEELKTRFSNLGEDLGRAFA
ncbi:MAG: DNA-directed RNA polymerase subunit D [Candidatus Thermoplasmatota archaeon]|nr:DNA-directed RNA polymerase subunit D [Candidatus Thermoplasmatota archaeon]MEC7253684.1 DNA-directed RNA polymerase subunit D [Candidatus Thermoplasmatota archaeon]